MFFTVLVTRRQSRLLHRLWSECASFVLRARFTSSTSTDAASDAITTDAVEDVLKSFSFDHSPSDRTRLPNHTRPQSSHAFVEGPISAEVENARLVPSVSAFSSSATAVVPLIARRIALPDALNIVPLVNVLPRDMASVYGDPVIGAQELLRPQVEVLALNLASPLQPPRVAGTRDEYVKLVGRMNEQGMLSFTAHPQAINGVFSVGKDADADRLIIDAQPANRLFKDSPHVSLPDPSHLIQLRVPAGASLQVGKSDLSNYYHHLGLPQWMWPYFALPSLTPNELRALGLDPKANFPVCVTLPMGFSHAVLLAQCSHEHVVYSSGALKREDNLLQISSPDVTRDRAIHGIEIDDFFLFCLDGALATRILSAVLDAYRAAGFVVKQSKVILPTSSPVKVIGLMFEHDVDGHTSVRLSAESSIDLARTTLAVLRRGTVSGIGLAHIIGRWTWCMLVRRPSLAVLQHVYKYIQTAHRRRFVLWPSVRRELWLLLGLLPLLHARLDVPTFRHAIATDASELGAGVVCSTITPELNARIWPVCSSRHHAHLQTIINAAVSRGEYLELEPDSSSLDVAADLFERGARSYSAFYADVVAARWSTIISSAWLVPEHINHLELRAVLLAVHWLLSYPSSHLSRVYLLVDSTVALFALWKGRTSSARLLQIVRKINALLLVSGVSLLTGWLPSAVNPADQPSRLLPSNTHRE